MQLIFAKQKGVSRLVSCQKEIAEIGYPEGDFTHMVLESQEYPVYLLETWVDGRNALEVMSSDALYETLRSIDRSEERHTREATGQILFDYPYTIYSIPEDTDCREGMGCLPHIHVHSSWLNVVEKGRIRPWEIVPAEPCSRGNVPKRDLVAEAQTKISALKSYKELFK